MQGIAERHQDRAREGKGLLCVLCIRCQSGTGQDSGVALVFDVSLKEGNTADREYMQVLF